MNVWLSDGESQIHLPNVGLFPVKPTPSPGVTVLERVGVVLYVNACELDSPSGAGNRPSKSSE